jgi:hypothetical protein
MEAIKKGDYYKYTAKTDSNFTKDGLYAILSVDSAHNVCLKSDSGDRVYMHTTLFNENFIKGDTTELAHKEVKTLDSSYKFRTITQGMLETYTKKNHDYGNSFDKSLDKFGLVASVVRIGDKMNRIESLVQKEAKVKDESIKDTLLDMANYCIMTVMWMDNQEK